MCLPSLSVWAKSGDVLRSRRHARISDRVVSRFAGQGRLRLEPYYSHWLHSFVEYWLDSYWSIRAFSGLHDRLWLCLNSGVASFASFHDPSPPIYFHRFKEIYALLVWSNFYYFSSSKLIWTEQEQEQKGNVLSCVLPPQGQYTFKCPTCNADWPYAEVRRLAALTAEEMQEFEMDLRRLAAKQLCDFKEVSGLIVCPKKEQTRLKDSLHQKRHGSVIIDRIKVNVGYSTGYGTGMARNRPPTGTSFTILASSIFESCRFAAVSQNTSKANQFAFAHEFSWAHIDPYAIHRVM